MGKRKICYRIDYGFIRKVFKGTDEEFAAIVKEVETKTGIDKWEFKVDQQLQKKVNSI